MTIFDIETGPLPAEELIKVKPEFTAPANYSDPKKIAAAIADKEKEWMEKAALSAVTGQVLAIGVMKPAIEEVFIYGESLLLSAAGEKDMLECFWHDMRKETAFVGFNIAGFDLPFLYRRSWKHGIMPPAHLRRGRYWSDCVIDLMDMWAFYAREQRESLDTVAKHLGVGSKTGSGKDFAGLWATDRIKAREYLANDLRLTRDVWRKLCCGTENGIP